MKAANKKRNCRKCRFSLLAIEQLASMNQDLMNKDGIIEKLNSALEEENEEARKEIERLENKIEEFASQRVKLVNKHASEIEHLKCKRKL